MALPWLIIVFGTDGSTPPPSVTYAGRYLSSWKKTQEVMRPLQPLLPPSPLGDAIKKAAAHMSSLGGIKRAEVLSAKQRSQIASNAAKARWK